MNSIMATLVNENPRDHDTPYNETKEKFIACVDEMNSSPFLSFEQRDSDNSMFFLLDRTLILSVASTTTKTLSTNFSTTYI